MDTFDSIRNRIREVYRAYNRPFIVGYSGGKDSTLTLQLTWEALQTLEPDQRKHPVFVMASNTRVENPYLLRILERSLDQINKAAKNQSMPIEAHNVAPPAERSFWVNLIGRGYPAPTQRFRWCTERLKIEPITRFVKQVADDSGEVIMVLGARSSESSTRAGVLASKARDLMGLSRHETLPGAYVFTPIEELKDDEVWAYILNHENPWGMDVNELSRVYKTASSETREIFSKDAPPSGSTRFGCWVCTLVQDDLSMRQVIQNDPQWKWMSPLLNFRSMIYETTDPEKKHIYRGYKGRDGKVRKLRSGEGYARRTLKLEWKREFLKQLLTAQKAIRLEGPDADMELISLDELLEIRRIWRLEDHDWQDSVSMIYREVTGKELPAGLEDGIRFNGMDFRLLSEICNKHDLPVEMVSRLVDAEQQMEAMNRRTNIMRTIDKILFEDWRNDEQLELDLRSQEK